MRPYSDDDEPRPRGGGGSSSGGGTGSGTIKGISEARLGSGYVAEAYGKHAIGGTLVSHQIKTITGLGADGKGEEKQINIKVLLGKGEFDGLERVTYDGVDIPAGNVQFFPGGSTVENDRYFPEQIKHKGIARLSISLPQGISDDDDPTKMVAVVRCKKVQEYDSVGNPIGSPKYSTNPADQFVDALRLDSLRKKVDFKERIDWSYYRTARDWYEASITYPDYGSVPRGYICRKTNIGNIPAGNYAVSVQAYKADGSITIRTGEVEISLEGEYKAIIVSGDEVSGANGYSIWIRRITDSIYYRTHVGFQGSDGKFEYTVTTLGNVETPVLAAGQHILNRPRFESHCAFTSPTNLNDVLNSICIQCATDWQKVGKQYRLLLPHNRPVQFHFNEDNTVPGSFRYSRTDTSELKNRLIVKFREITDVYLRESQPLPINREAAQTLHDVIPETFPLWSMSKHQAQRVGSYQMKQRFDRALYCNIEDDGSGAHLLPGDIVEVSDKGVEWVRKQFIIIEIERQDSDTGGRRKYSLKEWYSLDYQDSDGDNLPVSGESINNSPSKFAPPQPISTLQLSLSYEVKSDGTINNLIELGAQFKAHVTAQQGRVYHRKPGATDYQFIGLMHPEAGANLAQFSVNMADTGVHWFKVQVVSALGVVQEGTVIEYDINVIPLSASPPRPATASIARSSSSLRTTWAPPVINVPTGFAASAEESSALAASTTINVPVAEYLITDEQNNEVARTYGTVYEESVPPDTTVTRRIYTISTTGEMSESFAEAVYQADYPDKRIVFEVPVGSSDYVPYASDNQQYEEKVKIAGWLSYGAYNPDTDIWTRTDANGDFQYGWRAERAVAYGDCSVSYKIPYAHTAQNTSVWWGLGYGYATASSRYSCLYGFRVLTVQSVNGDNGGVQKLMPVVNGLVWHEWWYWNLGDVVTIRVVGNTVQWLKNNVLLRTYSIPAVPYPLYLDVYQQYQGNVSLPAAGGTSSPSDFTMVGFCQNITSNRPHWRNWTGLKYDPHYNLVRAADGNTFGGSGCSSVEYFLNGGFVEFRHSGTLSYCVVCGINDNDTDQHYTNMNYAIMVGTSLGVNVGFRIYESGTLVYTHPVGLSTSYVFRIAVEQGKVLYRLNGILVYQSANIPSATTRWFVDTALQAKGDILPDVVWGEVGSLGRGWKINPEGSAEFGGAVSIAGEPIDKIRARSITAIDASNRYRGNDYGVPVEAKITQDMISVSSIYLIESHFCYTDLYINLPDSLIKDPYANFDSIAACRVTAYNYFGEIVANVEQAFTGRGKIILGIHSRTHADPMGQAMFALEFRNVYGYSKPIYWCNFREPTSAWQVWYFIGGFSANASIVPPTFLAKSRYVTNVSAIAVDHRSIQVSWATEQTRTDTNATIRYVYIRRAIRSGTRDGWATAVPVAIGTTFVVMGGLVPDTEYEFLVHGTAGWEHSTYVIAKTLPPIHPQLLQRQPPSGLTIRVDGTNQITLFWTRNATSNYAVEFAWADGNVFAASTNNSGGVTSWTVGGLAQGTTYGFKVRNKWDYEPTYSEWSNTVYATTNYDSAAYAPYGLSGYSSGAYVQLNWNQGSGGEPVIEYYNGSGWYTWFNPGSGVNSIYEYWGYNSYIGFRVRNTTPVYSDPSNEVWIQFEPDYTDPGGGDPQPDLPILQ